MKKFNNQPYGSQVGRMNYGGAKFCRFALFPLMLLMLLLLPTGMVAQTGASSSKYIATYESSTQTLTFKKNVGESLPKNSAWVINKKSVAFINEKLGNVTIVHIVFDKSFSTYTPTSLFRFFKNLTKLETITGLEYLNTAKVTDMSYMFDNCSSLTSLDVTHFNTANVTNMSSMFSSCPSLTSLDVTHFNTAKVTDMSYMFCRCLSLTSLDVTYFNTAKVTDMSYMFSSCFSLTSLYLTNFNTEKVTNMSDMFSYCRALTTIYASSKFVTTQVSDSRGMFNNCKKLKGEDEWTNDKATDKTYAKIEGGYFSGAIPRVKYDDGTLTFFLTSKETLGENEYELNRGANPPGWANHSKEITKVVFDTSFANAKPTSCCRWFFGCDKLKQIEGIKNLNTENVKDMSNMFYGCSGLISLDVTNFNTANVTNMRGMFSSCNNLATIYTSEKFVTTKVENLNSLMFKGDENLKGALPVYKATKISCKYANYKTGYFTKLVGKNGDEKIGATGESLATDNLVLDDDKDFVAYEPFAAKAASYSRTVEGTTWATLCLPFEVSLDGQNFRAFKLLSADDVSETVELEEIETSIAAGTPVIIKMNDGETKLNFTVADKDIANEVKTAETASGNYQLQGLYTQKLFSKDTDNNCYIVKGDKLMNPAKLLGETTTQFVGSKPFRAYMVDNSSAPAAGARMFSISIGGSTTAIKQLETTADSKAEYYDLQGRRLQDLQKGINIVKRGGKTMKVIIK